MDYPIVTAPAYRFDDVVSAGLQLKARRNRPSTQKIDNCNARHLLAFFGGHWLTHGSPHGKRKIITPECVDQYIDARQRDGIGVSAVRRELAVGSGCIRICIKKKRWALPNPFENPDIDQAEPREREGTPNEIAALILAADQPLEDLIWYYVATWTRVAEGYTLEWDEISNGMVTPKHQKNGTRMPYALTPFAEAIIARQPRVHARVFTKDGKPLTKDGANGIDNMLRKARRKAGLSVASVRSLQLRDLRRTGGTWALAEAGIQIADIQPQMRHLTTAVTERVYARPSVTRAMAAVMASKLPDTVAAALRDLSEQIDGEAWPALSRIQGR